MMKDETQVPVVGENLYFMETSNNSSNFSLVDQAQDKEELKDYLSSHSLKTLDIIKEVNLTAGKELIHYMAARNLIIEQLDNPHISMSEQETIMRTLLLKRGSNREGYTCLFPQENYIWLLDDKFLTYNYIANDKTIKQLCSDTMDDQEDLQDGIDIGIYADSPQAKRIILIEFKKLNGSAIDQLFRYGAQFKGMGIDQIYLYLISDIDKDFRNVLIGGRNFSRVFSQEGEMYQGCFNPLNAYIQIISPKALIADAKARNKTFIDIIRKMNELPVKEESSIVSKVA